MVALYIEGLKMQLDPKNCLERILHRGYTYREISDDSGIHKASLIRIAEGRSSGKRVAGKLRESMVRFEKKSQEIEKLCQGKKTND